MGLDRLKPTQVRTGRASWAKGQNPKNRHVGGYLELGWLTVAASWAARDTAITAIPILGTALGDPIDTLQPWAVLTDSSGAVEVFGQRLAIQIYGEWSLQALDVPFEFWQVWVEVYAGLPRRTPTVLGQPGVVPRLVPPRAWRGGEQIRYESQGVIMQLAAPERLVPPQAVYYVTTNPTRAVSFETF